MDVMRAHGKMRFWIWVVFVLRERTNGVVKLNIKGFCSASKEIKR